MTKRDKSRLQAEEMRDIEGKTTRDRIRNTEIERELEFDHCKILLRKRYWRGLVM